MPFVGYDKIGQNATIHFVLRSYVNFLANILVRTIKIRQAKDLLDNGHIYFDEKKHFRK
jgi:hypothetical protein